MLKNVTITVDEKALRWTRHEAADKGISVSRLLGEMLERESRQPGPAYWAAYERWKKLSSIPGLDASKRLTREEAHDRSCIR